MAPQPAAAQLFDWFGGPRGYYRPQPQLEVPATPDDDAPVRRKPQRSTRYDKDANKFGKLAEPLTIVVSIAKQRVTLFSDGKQVAEAPVSTGTVGHETPMGIFAVIAKSRFHESNIYSGAPMPYMERITWSGIALHEGPLPGHAASHGCIRLPGSFASSLFKVTRLGARVVITRDPVAPVAFSSPRLFVPKKPEEKPAETPVAAAPPVVLADAQATSSIKSDESKPESDKTMSDKTMSDTHAGLGAPAVIAKLDDKPATVTPVVAKTEDAKPESAKPDSAKPVEPQLDARKRKAPVQVFVSRKTGRVYVRQAFTPLFDMPVTIAEPDKPWGTHIFTAMDIKDNNVRWTAITVPSGFAHKAERGKKLSAKEIARRDRLASDLANAPTAAVALERFELPKEASDRISELLGQGSSLIVSDNGLSEETGLETDFVIATP